MINFSIRTIHTYKPVHSYTSFRMYRSIQCDAKTPNSGIRRFSFDVCLSLRTLLPWIIVRGTRETVMKWKILLTCAITVILIGLNANIRTNKSHDKCLSVNRAQSNGKDTQRQYEKKIKNEGRNNFFFGSVCFGLRNRFVVQKTFYIFVQFH